MTAFKMEAALNNHIQEEIYSSYLYLSMAAYAHEQGLNGFAHWMKLQSQEEWGHAMKMFEFVIQRGGRVQLKDIKKPPYDFESIPLMMKATFAHEQKITALLNKLYDDAGKQKDTGTQVMLQWFVSEQIEEEAQISEILQKLKFVADKSSGLLYLDKEMKKRGEK